MIAASSGTGSPQSVKEVRTHMTSTQYHTTEEIRSAVHTAVQRQIVTDMHTHLFAPEFGSLNLFGIDALLGYHYLISELFRVTRLVYDDFWAMDGLAQADLIWRELFVRRAPISEATQGVVRVLTALGLDATAPDLTEAREYLRAQDPMEYANRILDMAGVDVAVMTNDPFDPEESRLWMSGIEINPRYKAALRLDQLLIHWPSACATLRSAGYDVEVGMTGATCDEVRRFLSSWTERMQPLYMAVSLPASFTYPDDTPITRLLSEAVLPACLEYDLPLALMIGVRRQVNPALRLAGDGVARADVTAVEHLASDYPDNRFLLTMLSRENQHELCVTCRKFNNILPFGCWWFLNNPSIIEEITRERLEMLGATFVAQHSDARVLDQLLYKWPVSREIIGRALAETYVGLHHAGRPVTDSDIEADVHRLLRGNFRDWTNFA